MRKLAKENAKLLKENTKLRDKLRTIAAMSLLARGSDNDDVETQWLQTTNCQLLLSCAVQFTILSYTVIHFNFNDDLILPTVWPMLVKNYQKAWEFLGENKLTLWMLIINHENLTAHFYFHCMGNENHGWCILHFMGTIRHSLRTGLCAHVQWIWSRFRG